VPPGFIKGEMYLLSVVDHRWVGCRLVSRKDSQGQWIWSLDGHCDRHWRSSGRRIPHALRRLFRLSGNDLHNASRNNWRRTSDAARRFRERQKALRAATLNVTQVWKTQMPDTNGARTILIREATPLPANLSIESEAFLPGWRVVKNPDRSTLARNIEGANWSFF